MAVPVTVRVSRQQQQVAGAAVVSVLRVECLVALPWFSYGFVLARPVGVGYASAAGSRFRPVFDPALVTTAATGLGLTALGLRLAGKLLRRTSRQRRGGDR